MPTALTLHTLDTSTTTVDSVKGTLLTIEEMDSNFLNLRATADAALQTIPTASPSVKGGVRVGTGLTMTGDVLSTTAASYTLPIATGSELGGVKVGSGLSINGSGVLSATAVAYTLPNASSGTLGGIKVGTGLTIDGAGVLTPDLDTLFSAVGQRLLASNGYQKLPGGLIIQWGQYIDSGLPLAPNNWYQTPNQNFPIPFPHAVLVMTGSSQLNFVIAQAVPLSNSQYAGRFSAYAAGGNLNVSLFWIAIGY